ncbi:conserved hypothetical protein [Candidatus Koribacter versatilis Ellin345]|uniref:NAD-dependent epimerase/dehydratase n=1 Tax=Koribacter versatilis (strain Ellin345) TaxID=204669 RepID=Q1IVP0_KORVE|nr:TIGR01777 family oxidoreductase [Candidatus Koribacter versatilis]ABF39060.1 conserved hypothetical protein [Candidatus Koribacter versatilis Ellin345]
MNVFVTGSTGLIGRAVSARLRSEGHTVTPLVRGTPKAREVQWSPGKTLDPAVLASADAVIHLAGKNVATRWTPEEKKELYESRVAGTKTISDAVAEAFRRTGKPTVLISASAIGYYGNRGDEVLTEESAPGSGFLHDICVAWEGAAQSAKDAGVRVVHPRIGVVLSKDGGALAQMLPIFKLGAGGRLSGGRQWWSWISIHDIVGAMMFALNNVQVSGPVNFTGPYPVTNAAFTKVLGMVLHRPTLFPVPRFALHIAMGKEAAEETALGSLRVLPKRLLDYGYQFQHADLREALHNVVN